MTIACGTDFSSAAEGALRVAAMLAAARKEPLALVHVSEGRDAERDERELREAAERARALGAVVETEVKTGDPARVLVAHTKAAGASLLVVARHGGREPARFSLGSVAERLAQSAPAPVLLVGDAAPLEAWLRRERDLEVVLAADRSATSRGALRALRVLNDAAQVSLVVAHVTPEADPSLERSLASDLADDLAASGTVEAEMKIVEREAGEKTDDALVSFAAANAADVMVLGIPRRSSIDRWWRGSVSRGVLRRSTTSVLLVPAAVAVQQPRFVPILRSVLVATDLSDMGNAAVLHAASLLPDGGVLHVAYVHVLEEAKTPVQSLLPARAAILDERARADVEARLEGAAPTEIAAQGVRVETHVEEARDVADALCALADRLAVDVMVMGSRGLSRAAAAVLGSTAHAVLSRSSRPVLIVTSPLG